MPSKKNKNHRELSLQTKLIGAGLSSDTQTGAIAPPLHLTSTYGWQSIEEMPDIDYGRTGSPVRQHLEKALAELDGAVSSIFTNNGMSAAQLILNVTPQGAHIVAPHDCYGGTYRLLNARAEQGHFSVDFVDMSDERNLDAAFKRRPSQLWLESPSNPLMRVTDLRKWIHRAKEAGAFSIIDHTLLTPLGLQPLVLGADIAWQSTTKFVNGHSDCLGGSVSSADPDLMEKLRWWHKATGAGGSAFDAYQTLRGLRTLPLRLERQQQNCQKIAQWLEGRKDVAQVFYTGLKTHPGYEIANMQQKGHGALLAFKFHGAEKERVANFAKALNIFRLAPSLGGFESLICTPFTMTHAGMSEKARLAAGITPDLVRLAIGLEKVNDLTADLEQAFTMMRT